MEMTQKQLYESKEELRESLARLLNQAKRERMSRGRPTRKTTNKYVHIQSKINQLNKDIREQLVSQEVIGFELH